MSGRVWPVAAVLLGLCAGVASADQPVTLPYTSADIGGIRWMVDQGGNIQMQGNLPVWAQAAMLTVDGNQRTGGPDQPVGQIDAKTGELVIDAVKYGQCTAQRRILFPKDNSFVRVVDMFKNPTNQAITITPALRSTVNYGVRSSSTVTDPRHPENTLAVTAMTQVNRVAVEVFGGAGARVFPSVASMNGNQNVIQASIKLTIPAGGARAWMHLLETTASEDQGHQDVLNYKAAAMTKDLPPAVRRAIVNFPGGANYGADYDLPREPSFDVIELRTGGKMRGTLKETAFKLATFFGSVDLPANQVIGLLNVGEFKPRQLVVMQDGQVFGGTLGKTAIDMELSSGQTVSVPLSQLARIGCRTRADEPDDQPDDQTGNKPFILMRQGDRINIEMPTAAIEVMTRYGMLKVDPAAVKCVDFQSDQTEFHLVELTDGSRIGGLVTSPDLELTLSGGIAGKAVKVPTNALVNLSLVTKSDDDAQSQSASLNMLNQDQLMGTLSGQLKLDTAFDTLAVDGGQIRKISHASEGSPDVTVTMWDDSEVGGQLESPSIACKLKSGLTIDVPLAMLQDYTNSSPKPSDTMVQKVKDTVAKLGSDDFKIRDAAQETLLGMGPIIAGELQELRPTQPPEAQQRIDTILRAFAAQKKPVAVDGGVAPAGDRTRVILPLQRQFELMPQQLDLDDMQYPLDGAN